MIFFSQLGFYTSFFFCILMHFFEKNGVCIKSDAELFIDSFGLKNSNVLVSHAHSDHCRLTGSNTYFMTEKTRVLANPKSNVNIIEKSFGEKFEVNGFEVSMHPSGHIVGSSQFQIANGSSAVVTSDFKLQESLLLKPANILQGDILVMETTFGTKDFSFPVREQVYADLAKFVNERISKNFFVVLGGYSTGKAQELTKFCNEYLGVAPLVHKSVFEKNKLVEKTGLSLGNYILLDHNLRESNVLIMPPHLLNRELVEVLSLQLGKHVECAVATGWKKFGQFKSFPLSDHADFNQLLDYVEGCKPKLVLTYHGFDEEFSKAVFKKFGIPSQPLRLASQKTLSSYFERVS